MFLAHLNRRLRKGSQMMDPKNSAQDVIRCILCQTFDAPMFCEVCHIHMCKDCVNNHLSEFSKVHKVVSLKQHWAALNYPKCWKHPTKQCELHCEQCDIPICVQCMSSGKHLGHKQVDISKPFQNKREILQKYLQEFETLIHPKYQEIASNIHVQKADLSKNSQKLITAINKQGEVWHREIDNVVTILKSNVEEMESKHLVHLDKQEDEITRTISEITKSIDGLKKLLNSKDVGLVSKYKSSIAEFRRLPPKLNVFLPNFRPQEIHTDQLIEQFGSLSALSFTKQDQDYSMQPQGAEASPPNRSLMDVPLVIGAIDTGYKNLYDVTCLNDTEFLVSGRGDMIKLFNLQGELLKSIQTNIKRKNVFFMKTSLTHIAVTRRGDLVYAEDVGFDKTINIVKNSKIETVIRPLREWIPRSVCDTSYGDFLVVMNKEAIPDDVYVGSDEEIDQQTKVVRYYSSKEEQIIQFNDKGEPLYSSGGYISENRNLDICVTDPEAHSIVVVNQAGKLRFTYTGPPSTLEGPFDPRGITTDSQGRILTADNNNYCIHILDQDGQFLRNIRNCHLQNPWALCVDSRDNLFVAEFRGKVKKIKIYK